MTYTCYNSSAVWTTEYRCCSNVSIRRIKKASVNRDNEYEVLGYFECVDWCVHTAGRQEFIRTALEYSSSNGNFWGIHRLGLVGC